MNRYKIFSFFIVFILLICHPSFGQDVKVRGTVVDSLSGNPEIAAIVQFYKAEDPVKPIAYTITDADGVFSHSLPGGEYRLFLQNLGRKDKSIMFIVEDNADIDLGTIPVEDDAETLKAVSVTALSKLVSIDSDKITYKVESDIEAKTKSVLDILRKIPLVSVSAQGVISVNGSSSFIVIVDGMKNHIMTDNPSEMFAAMPASMVQSIEVITEPGARYDAEGVGAVLSLTSITTGKDGGDGGFHNANVNIGGSLRRVNGGAFFAAVKDKWTVSMDVAAINVWSGDNGLYRERISNAGNGQMTTISSGVSNSVTTSLIGGLNASYEINKHNLLFFSAGVIDLSNKDKEFLDSRISAGSQDYEYEEQTASNMRFDRFNANIDYQHLWKDGSKKTFVLSYQISGNPTRDRSEDKYIPLTALPSSLIDRKNDRLTNSLTHSIQSDLILPVSKKHSFITGAKFMFRHNMSEANVQMMTDGGYVEDESQRVNFDFYNNIGALYAEYSGMVKFFRLRAGVRYEHTWQRAQYKELPDKDFGLDYGNLVPNGSIHVDINDSQNLGLSYSMSIRRPGITYLNPYVDLSDPSSKTYGNPDLKAETGHQLGLSYNIISGKWIVTMRLRQNFSNDGISKYMFYDENNILNNTYGNIINSSSTSLNAYVSWSPVQKTNIILSGQTRYSIFKSAELDINTDGWTYELTAMLQQSLPAGLVLNASVLYLPSTLSLQSRTNGLWTSELSLSRSFLNDRLNVSLRGMTHFTKHYGALMETTYSGNNFTAKDEIIMPWRDVFISLSYTFGNSDHIQVKKSKKKSSANDQIDQDKTAKTF